MPHIHIDGNGSLIRDSKTNCIINTNTAEFQEYKRNLTIKQQENQRIQNLEQDLASLKNDLNEIKNLLRSIANES